MPCSSRSQIGPGFGPSAAHFLQQNSGGKIETIKYFHINKRIRLELKNSPGVPPSDFWEGKGWEGKGEFHP